MLFSLQDEPEKAGRIGVLAVGVILAVGLQGGGLVAANGYKVPPRKKAVRSVMMITTPPPPPPKVEPPKPPEVKQPEIKKPEPEIEKPKPKPKKKKKRPKPKKKKRPKKKHAAKPKKPQPKPQVVKAETPQPKTDKPPMLVQGLSNLGPGTMKTQGGNTNTVGHNRVAEPAATGPAPTGEKTQLEPQHIPVRVAARCHKRFKPDYTKVAARQGIEGRVVLLASIDATGKVTRVKVVKGLGFGLDEVAREAVLRWRYRPATVDGEPIASMKRETIKFELED